MQNLTQYEPLDEYKNIYKPQHEQNVSEYFENLVRKSAVDEQKNRLTVKKIRQKEQQIAKFNKKKRKLNNRQDFLSLAIVVSIFIFAYCVIKIFSEKPYNSQYAGIAVGVVLLIILFIIIILKKTNPKIKSLTQVLEQYKKTLEELVNSAYNQLSSLFPLFNRHISPRLMEKTYPLIHLDDFFDIRRYDYLNRKYGLPDSGQYHNQSTFFAQSGEINGNPFCFFKTLNHFMGSKEYEGTKTIHWTEYYTDEEGKEKSRSRSETLRAYVTKPFPKYYDGKTCLVYGNEAAPNLVFKRTPSFAAKYQDTHSLEKQIKRKIKDLEEEMRKRIKRGGNFTMMGNGEFDVLFGATNRNNEVEFRLLFTPIAQREMLKLIKDKTTAWGDNFSFSKNKMINTIFHSHLNTFNISGNPKYYIHYDIDTVRKQFCNYNNLYFKSIYFAFTPLLVIPEYQQNKASEFVYRDVYQSNLCGYAHECEVNRQDISLFAHPNSVTRNILKTIIHSHDNESDHVEVSAHGFSSKRHVEYISVYGGDGNYHDVAVYWNEYKPVCRTTRFSINVEKARE